uniref:Uncharacterized protein n=1 Tax=Romanomermis culicivorax TaxID=13658 RepID=A0A915L4J6_ROMCU
MNQSFSSSGNKPIRTFNDYDPDDILGDLKNLQNIKTISTYRATSSGQKFEIFEQMLRQPVPATWGFSKS